MDTTQLRQIRDEIEEILASVDRCYWSNDTRARYRELSRRETAILQGRELAGV
jgi:hypothetical protein